MELQLDRHQVSFLDLQYFVDLRNVPIRQFLDLILGAAFLILGNLLLLQQVLEVIVGIAAHIAYRHPRVSRLRGVPP